MTAATGWGELGLSCYACGAPVTVCGYIADLRPDDPYRCLGCRHAIQDERDRSFSQIPECARALGAHNELTAGLSLAEDPAVSHLAREVASCEAPP